MPDRLTVLRPLARAGLVALAFFAAAAAPGAETSEPWPHEHSDVPPDPRITWGRLPNGLRYAIRHNEEPRGRVSLVLDVHVGSVDERDDQQGYAHFVEHMLFNGTRLYPGPSLVEELQRDGLAFGADINAFTTLDHTFYSLDLPQNSPERIAHGFEVLREFADGATFPKAALKKERDVIEAERRTRETSSTAPKGKLDRFLYPDSRIARREPIGKPECLDRATVAALADFYHAHYRPARMTLIAVGDADPAVIARLLAEKFGSLRPGTPEAPPQPALGPFTAAPGTIARFIPAAPELGCTALISCLRPPDPAGDTIASRRRNAQEAAGFWILNERLQAVVRNDPIVLGGGHAQWDDFRREVRTSEVRMDCRATHWRRALRTGEQELRRALTLGFTAGEVREQIERFRTFNLDAIHTEAGYSSAAIAQAIRSNLEENVVSASAQQAWDLIAESVTQLTPETCSAHFREAWAPANRRLAVIGPGSLALKDADVAAAFSESAQGFLLAADDSDEVKFAYTDFGPPGQIMHRRHVDAVDADEIEFANRVRLNLKKTDFEPGRVYLTARVGRGLAEQPAARPGLGLLSENFLLPGGLRRHDEAAIQRLTAGATIQYGFQVGENACLFSSVGNRESLPLMFQLLAAYLTDAGFRVEAYAREIGRLQSYYANSRHDPVEYLRANAPRVLAGGDNRYGVPEYAQTIRHSPQEVKEWLTPILAHGDLEIGVIGDFDLMDALEAARRTVGAGPTRNPDQPVNEALRPEFPARAIRRVWHIEGNTAKAAVEVVWPGTDDADYTTTRRLQVLSQILNDRVRVKLREELGLTYSPSAGVWGSVAWPGYGWTWVEVVVSPAQADKAASLIAAIARDLAEHGCTEDEYARARQPILANLDQVMRSTEYWMPYIVPQLQSFPHVIEAPLTRTREYQEMRRQDVEAVARRYLGSENSCTFIVLPE